MALAGCWAHVRRKFYEARETAPRLAGWLLRQLQHLYAIESRLRDAQAGPQLRQAVRASESRPIVARLERVLLRLKTNGKHLPQSPLGSAMMKSRLAYPRIRRESSPEAAARMGAPFKAIRGKALIQSCFSRLLFFFLTA